MAIEIDLSQAPVVFTKFDGEQTMEQLERYIAQMDLFFTRKQRYLSITWLKKYARSSDQLKRTATWFKERESVMRELCIASTIISTNPAFRFALSALFLIKPLNGPYIVCSNFDEAVAFGQQQFKKRGLTLPAIRNPWS
jgi:hypothetical protein